MSCPDNTISGLQVKNEHKIRKSCFIIQKRNKDNGYYYVSFFLGTKTEKSLGQNNKSKVRYVTKGQFIKSLEFGMI